MEDTDNISSEWTMKFNEVGSHIIRFVHCQATDRTEALFKFMQLIQTPIKIHAVYSSDLRENNGVAKGEISSK